jgi:hypothetical protein
MIVADPPYGEIRNDTYDLGGPATLTGRMAQLYGDLAHVHTFR